MKYPYKVNVPDFLNLLTGVEINGDTLQLCRCVLAIAERLEALVGAVDKATQALLNVQATIGGKRP